MNTDVFVLSIVTINFLLYILFISLKYGILPSISDSYYKLGKYDFFFSIFILSISIPIFKITNFTLMYIAASCISIVSAAPMFKDKIEKNVHYIAALFGMIFALISLTLDYDFIWSLIISILFMLFANILKLSNKIFWIEIVIFLSIFIGLIYKLY